MDAREWDGRLTFADVGAVVYYLKAIPWEVAGFGVRTHFDRLIALQERPETKGEFSFYAGKFPIEARKPNAARSGTMRPRLPKSRRRRAIWTSLSGLGRSPSRFGLISR